MKCPECSADTTVADSRAYGLQGARIRRRRCLKCQNRFNTLEIVFHGKIGHGSDTAPEDVNVHVVSGVKMERIRQKLKDALEALGE